MDGASRMPCDQQRLVNKNDKIMYFANNSSPYLANNNFTS